MKNPILINKISAFILDIFFPTRCLICGKYGHELCFDCAQKIEIIKTHLCPECGKISSFGSYCDGCRRSKKPHLSKIIVATRYNVGPIKQLVSSFKYEGFQGLAKPLGELIVCQLKSLNISFDKIVVVPVPLYITRKNRRGFNQSELLARYISKELSLHGGDALARIRDTISQVSLKKSQRTSNISGAFICIDRELILNSNIILVDDVVTTGATLTECAKVLKENGAKKIIGAVIARNI
jgi:competence protein ComFC